MTLEIVEDFLGDLLYIYIYIHSHIHIHIHSHIHIHIHIHIHTYIQIRGKQDSEFRLLPQNGTSFFSKKNLPQGTLL